MVGTGAPVIDSFEYNWDHTSLVAKMHPVHASKPGSGLTNRRRRPYGGYNTIQMQVLCRFPTLASLRSHDHDDPVSLAAFIALLRRTFRKLS